MREKAVVADRDRHRGIAVGPLGPHDVAEAHHVVGRAAGRLAGDLQHELDGRTRVQRMSGAEQHARPVDQQLAAADRFLRFHLAAMGRNHLSQEEHRGLIDACSAHDAEEACAAVTRFGDG